MSWFAQAVSWSLWFVLTVSCFGNQVLLWLIWCNCSFRLGSFVRQNCIALVSDGLIPGGAADALHPHSTWPHKLYKTQELFNKYDHNTLNYTIWHLWTWVKWVEYNQLTARWINSYKCTDRNKPETHSCTTANIHEQTVYYSVLGEME